MSATNVTFDQWFESLEGPIAHKIAFGTFSKVDLRDAWNAAVAAGRETCAEIADMTPCEEITEA